RDFHVTGVQTCALPISAGVGHLVVVVEEVDEGGPGQVERRRAAILALPGVPLTLVQPAPARGADQLLGPPARLRQVGLVAAGERSEERRVGREGGCRSG